MPAALLPDLSLPECTFMPIPPLSIEDRLQRVEDQLAIYQIISSYGPAADSCNMTDIEKHWDEHSIYDMGDVGVATGCSALKALFDAPFHQGIVKDGSAHIASFPHVVIDGDRAVATHYAQVHTHRNQEFVCLRVSVHRWELERRAHGWKLVRRTTSLLDGNQRARALLAQAMQPPGAR